MPLLETIGAELKAAMGIKRKVQFANYGAGGAAYGGHFGPGLSSGWGGKSPGATYDYATAAGELWENRVVGVCVNAIAQALQDAPPFLEQRDGDKWAKVNEHPIIELLTVPNGYYGSPHLWSATAASEVTRGEAFWRIEKNRAGVPAELWWEEARRFQPIGNGQEFISGYRFQTETGAHMVLDNDEVIHFRYALDPYNPRHGRTPLQAGLRQIALDNGIASYSGSILRNSGVMSLLISAKDAAAGAQIAPAQIQEFVEKLKQRLFGEGAGGIAGLNLPLDVQKMSYSPDEMAVDKLTAYAEASICALCGVDPMVAGLSVGAEHRTYANMAEALNDFWERRIIPTKNRHSAELGAQLLPLFQLDPKDYRIAWDYSKVAPLQENGDETHARVREDFKAGVISLHDARTALGLEVDDSMKGVFYKPPAKEAPNDSDNTLPMNNTEKKSTDEAPEPLPDPHGLAFTPEQLDRLIDTNTEAAVTLAFAGATGDVQELLTAKGSPK